MKYFKKILLIAAVAASFLSAYSHADPKDSRSAPVAVPGQAVVQNGSAINFTLMIAGTRSYQDVNLIRKNLKGISGMQSLVPFEESQMNLKFSGRFLGTADSLVSDIESLAMDRFEVKKTNDKKRGLTITLRKITAKP